MKSIVLAEKPSVGKDLGKYLKCSKKTKGYWEGPQYIVTWAMGHLVELADPGVYDERYKPWKLDHLPMLPDRMKYRVIGRTSLQFKTIKSLFNRKDVTHLIIATDAGREGELVARLIMRLGGWKGPFSRLWISSQTETAIRDGFRNLKPGADFDNLFHAAECRAEADWIIGLNITRALTCKNDARLSAGRVQTPTLGMLVSREQERENFSPSPYWTIKADFGPFEGLWVSPKRDSRLSDPEIVRSIVDRAKDRVAVISGISRREKSTPPPLAYDLAALQRDANAVLGFSAKQTLNTLQSLYERHRIMTYPRTDSRYITEDVAASLSDRLTAIQDSPYGSLVRKLLGSPQRPGKRFVDGSRVTDHHAVIPTEQKVNLEALNRDERSLWNLVVQRFIAVLLPPFRFESTSISLMVEGEQFTVKGIRVLDRGWRVVPGAGGSPAASTSDSADLAHSGSPGDSDDPGTDEAEVRDLSRFEKGQKLTVRSVREKRDFTKPPPRYTEGTLIAAMENAGRLISDRSLKESISQMGIGTPATRADIIEKLLSNYYMERTGRDLVPTSLGIELLDIVPDQLKSPELTARWEQRLSLISKGSEQAKRFSMDIRESARDLVEEVKKSQKKYSPRNVSKVSCPLCGRKMLSVRDKKGRKLLACPAFSCGHEQSEEPQNSISHRPSKREQVMNQKLIRQYSDRSKETVTLGDLIKAAQEKKHSD